MHLVFGQLKRKDMIYHFQNHCYKYFTEFCDYLFNCKVTIPDDLQIITCCNWEDQSILINQLRRNKIPYINKVPFGIEWDNRIKIKYILEALQNVSSRYVLILDANDVLIEDVSNIITDFDNLGYNLLYNATCHNYPDVDIDHVPGRERMGKFKYFNAGCCIGKTEYTKHFYENALKYIDVENPWKSEQYIIRHVFQDCVGEVMFDYQCKLFQTVGGCSLMKLNNIWRVI